MRNFALLALVLGLAACRGGGNSGDDDNSMPDGQNTEDVKIQDIQNDSMPACDPADPATCVELHVKGVVVTAIDTYGSKTGDFWVQEPEGGEFSGVKVYGAPIQQVAELSPGDIVDIAGAQKAEFALDTDTSGNKLTELEPFNGSLTVTRVSDGTPLEPEVVDALMIGQMPDRMARHAEWEKWEGVLIKVNNVSATSSDKCVGSACNDATLRSFGVTGDVLVESALAAMPEPSIARDDCLASATGVLEYFFDYQILPRTTAEIGTGGTSCPPLENTAELCGDNVDNDGNGFSDCDDFSCQTSQAACVSHPSIEDIQTGEATGYVQLDSVYVIAVSYNKSNLWVATSLTAAPNQGIFVYRGDSMTPDLEANIVPGAKVSVKGLVQENNNDSMGETITQIGASPIVTFLEAPAANADPVPVTDQMATGLVAAATGEPYESVLVTLTNVNVKTQGTTAGYYVGELDQGGTVFFSDDDVFRLLDAKDTCYASITGIWSYDVFSNSYGLLPTTAPTPNGTCN